MAIAFRAASTVTHSGTTPSLAKPAGLLQDDVMFAWFVLDRVSVTVTTLAGWTLAAGYPLDSTSGSCRSYLFYKVAGGSEPATYDWTTGDAFQADSIVAYSGVRTDAPINQNAANPLVNNSTPASPSITPTVGNCMIVAFLGADPSVTVLPISPDASPVATERVEIEEATTLTANYVEEYLQAAAAAISLDATAASGEFWVGATIALEAAGVATRLRLVFQRNNL